MSEVERQKSNSPVPMETNGTRSSVKANTIRKLLVPPGFVSHTAFVLKKMASGEDTQTSATLKKSSDLTPSSTHEFSSLEDNIAESNLQIKHRAWIVHDPLDHHEEKSDDVPNYENASIVRKDSLPKGLIWGCTACSNCLKVPAQWDPKGACSVSLEEAPVFQPTDEEFRDTLKYIESIRQQVKPYGLCRIVPPPSWQPPCFFGENSACKSFSFATEAQKINEFRNSFKRKRLTSRKDEESKRRMISKLDVAESQQVEEFQFQFGPHFTLESFKRKADYFKKLYFSKQSKVISQCHGPWEPSEENIEGEYWRILEKPTAEIEVLRGANLDTVSLRSRFIESFKTKASDSISYQDSGWNLSNLSRLPHSLFSFEDSYCTGDLAPQLHIGMCFSTLSWEVEKHNLYSLYYEHYGAPKIWYSAPGHYFNKLQAVVEKHFPNIFVRHPELLHKLAMQISPATLQAEGIPVYRCIQRPKEFILFLPGTYHTGFDCGFNVSESVCCAPLDWLPDGQSVTELYREKKMKPLISHERLLLRAAHEAVIARWEFILKNNRSTATMRWQDAVGKDGVIAGTLKVLVKSEARQRKYLCTSNSKSRKMDMFFDKGVRKQCSICNFILYLSAAFCTCKPNKYACLKHVKHLCPCAWSQRVFLFRFDISELEHLVEATQGKFSAINRWVKENLGKALEYDTADSNVEVISTDESSIAKVLEYKGETSSSSVYGTNAKDASRKLVSESVTRIWNASPFGASKYKFLDAWKSENTLGDDSSSESDDERLSSQFRLKEDKPLFPSHSASNGQAAASSKLGPGETQEKSSCNAEVIVCLSSSEDED